MCRFEISAENKIYSRFDSQKGQEGYFHHSESKTESKHTYVYIYICIVPVVRTCNVYTLTYPSKMNK